MTVVIIGAGPAGLNAASAARTAGADVVLLDAAELGGQYWRHLPPERPARRQGRLHHGWSRFTALRDRLAADAGCEIVTGAQVWAIDRQDDGLRVHVLVGQADGRDRTPRTLRPTALVLATGAHDRTLPFPGWDLPGVYSAGAAQALAKGERVAVGGRVLVAGAGPFLLPVAASLTHTGARVVGVHEAARPSSLLRNWAARPWELGAGLAKAGELGGYVLGQLRHRIPYVAGSAVIAAHGDERVESVTVARLDPTWAPLPGTGRRIEVDAVCVSHGFTPRLELAIAAGCRIGPDRFVVTDSDGRTSVDGVFAAGEITGIGGAQAAETEGVLAGRAAAGAADDRRTAALRRRRAGAGRFAARIEQAHGIRPGWTAWLDRDTVLCRCEEVTHGELVDAVDTTRARGLRSTKLTSRAGLGICQARMCGRNVEEVLGQTVPDGAIADTSTDRRPLAAPISLAELAALPAAPTAQEGHIP
ncbi:NADPH-dependent 2,4-dienoyl-CoA reductase/sulfur reductase-like enzyme [Actinoalloteichus hoggarensis]|uniref:Hydrogen cyanide synthase subunit HcnB n=1 Tax=Actinoalloteichus hoggarensis TaxID=1470176 RepID=A0A221W4P8_9PSEU|nr:FAD-dependent oxidoreductase [Actinoalloteichus hoggarensis]ASO20626.1 Hydrogen cyanide synthase subunit HcnB [Actinoalloteichus hoggarensis]MBB5923667.1 NADPH-dependent 2,4-dienoyl-CoA reductase/sulfur reductase-like enzyme [Actinoalloteichus hoggarensis]